MITLVRFKAERMSCDFATSIGLSRLKLLDKEGKKRIISGHII